MTLAVLCILEILEIRRFFRLLVFLAAFICFHSILFFIIIAFLIILILFTIHDFSASYCQEAKNFLGFHASKRDTTQ